MVSFYALNYRNAFDRGPSFAYLIRHLFHLSFPPLVYMPHIQEIMFDEDQFDPSCHALYLKNSGCSSSWKSDLSQELIEVDLILSDRKHGGMIHDNKASGINIDNPKEGEFFIPKMMIYRRSQAGIMQSLHQEVYVYHQKQIHGLWLSEQFSSIC